MSRGHGEGANGRIPDKKHRDARDRVATCGKVVRPVPPSPLWGIFHFSPCFYSAIALVIRMGHPRTEPSVSKTSESGSKVTPQPSLPGTPLIEGVSWGLSYAHK